MKQLTIKKITGKIVVKTGLHIGAGNNEVEIGGVDSPVIRNPRNNEPYIPGSSIKGKMRSLIEWKSGILSKTDGKPCSCGKADCPVCRVFGSLNNSNTEKGPTRIIVRDAMLSEKSKKGKVLVEEKSENTLNRITAEAMPRNIERVVPGVEFDFDISYRVIDTGDNGVADKKNFDSVVLEGLRMLQNDYLGGSGTRGYGQIGFAELKDENGKEIVL